MLLAAFKLVGLFAVFAAIPVSAADSGETAFSETLGGEIPYWKFGSGQAETVRFEVSRTVAMEYRQWLGEREPTDAADEARYFHRFSLDRSSPDEALPVENAFPRRTEVTVDEEKFPAIAFVAKREPRKSRILYSLERREGDGSWIPVRSPKIVSREPLEEGLELRVLRDSRPLKGDFPAQLRLRIRCEPVPTIFAHYISELNPGWGAMAHLMQPTPAFFRLFHDRAENLEPVPQGLPDTFASTGGPHRDLPLIPPGFSFPTATESAELEIARARRTGLDGFAVNCLDGRTDFLAALFTAAKNRQREHSDEPPFLLTLSLDINVLPFRDRDMLPTVAGLVARWLKLAEEQEAEQHLARRGGKPLVMGYQSHWIWVDYFHRLLELWEWEQPGRTADDRLRWPENLGPAPAAPVLPGKVARVYGTTLAQQKFAETDPALDSEILHFRRSGFAAAEAVERARESVARKRAREAAVKQWAQLPDGWARIREAYRLLERLVGEEIFWQFDAVDLDAVTGDFEKAVEVVARDFPAVNFFLPKGNFTDAARRIVRERGAEWGEPIYSQYVAYAQNEQNGLFRGNAHGGDGTATFRRGWATASGRDPEAGEAGRSSLIQYTTWNDYNEHTHLAPSLQMRHALSELARHFIHAWRTGQPVGSLGEQVFLFYRKHPPDAKSFPFRSGTALLPAVFEVVTILDGEGARLELLANETDARARSRTLDAGLHVERFRESPPDFPEVSAFDRLWQEGPVRARVQKPSGETLIVPGWEEVTHRPFREDTTLVGASSRCGSLWAAEMREFGLPDLAFSEYGDADDDGLPNWFEMFYFGRGWLHPGDQTRARPGADENRDGVTNLEHFRSRTHPTRSAEPFPYRETKEGVPVLSRIDPARRTRIRAEDFDRGGAGVAYRRSSYETIHGGGYRRELHELPTHVKVDAHEEDGGDWMVAPLSDGEWQTYTLEISAGCYEIAVRVREGGGKIRAEFGGREVLEADIESRTLWSTQTLGRIRVPQTEAGPQVLRLHFDSPGYGLNWIEFRPCRR